MSVLEGLEPKAVFKYFEEICAIPHGSGNTSMISSYLVEFAKQNGLRFVQDSIGNVVIYCPATAGYENEETIIIQGHMDMVAVAEEGSNIDMQKEGLRLLIDGDYVTADGTSLGGDDGIALAYMLSILSDNTLCHPAIEAVITVDEETGMEGVSGLDASVLSGKRLLNIDNEEEGHFVVGCAGGARTFISLPITYKPLSKEDKICKISVSGGAGGHSGVEINSGRANANVILGEVLETVCISSLKADKCMLIDMSGGQADNVIPSSSEAIIAIPASYDIRQMTKDVVDGIYAKYIDVEKHLKIDIAETKTTKEMAVSVEDTIRVVQILSDYPNGVQAMSKDDEGLVETSLNLGIMYLAEKTSSFELEYLIRSSVDADKEELKTKMANIAKGYGADIRYAGDYPGWKYRSDSPLRDKMVNIYKMMFKEEPIVEAIHAGLECGFFARKIPGLDCVSIGPNMEGIHSPMERLSISSTIRVYDYICHLLSTKDT